jgi:DNA-binding NtrC family response regulator
MNKKQKILIVDDNKDVLIALELLLQEHFDQIDTCKSPNVIPEKLRKHDYDVIILDMNFVAGVNTGNEGFYWLNKIFEFDPEAAVLFLTAYADIEKAVQAIQQGAADYIEKPWNDEKLIAAVFKAVSQRQSKKEIKRLKRNQKHLNQNLSKNYTMIRGHSPAMQKVYETIEKVAATDANVLILGENGTGKEIIARELHQYSNRASEMFVNVDLAALNENVFESELFGHVKGAFTDAKESRTGRFELATGGTLFLDEIGNLSMNMQAKLLVALQNREITPVGASKNIPVDIRLISATNKNIQEKIKENLFREDLFYRINTITIEIPPLRERKEDIPAIANHYVNFFSQKYHSRNMQISEAGMNKVIHYSWPGNIRELKHQMEKAVIMTNSSVLSEKDILVEPSVRFSQTNSLNLAENEKILISKAIEKNHQNYTKAAEELGITRRTLYNKIKHYEL